MADRPLDHWVVIPDEDLSFIEGFDPDRERSASRDSLIQVIVEIQGIIADGLETA